MFLHSDPVLFALPGAVLCKGDPGLPLVPLLCPAAPAETGKDGKEEDTCSPPRGYSRSLPRSRFSLLGKLGEKQEGNLGGTIPRAFITSIPSHTPAVTRAAPIC